MNLYLSVKDSPWREQDPSKVLADTEFDAVRPKLLAKHTHNDGSLYCHHCNNMTKVSEKAKQGFFDIHHLDDDHSNNDWQKNLALLCPFCHMVYHIGFYCMTGRAFLVYAPEIPQIAISRLSFSVCLTVDMDKPTKLATCISQQYASLAEQRLLLDSRLGKEASINIANMLMDVRTNTPPEEWPKKQKELVGDLRIVPYLEHQDWVRHVDYWRGVHANRVKNFTNKLEAHVATG